MRNEIADLVVIGAGPAGCALALALARSGYDVVLCDQHRVPRDKLCGETLSPLAVRCLQDLGLSEPLARELDPPVVDRLTVTAARARALVHPLHPPGLGLSRLGLDGRLATACTAAGVEIKERWRAICVRAEMGADQSGLVVEGIGDRGMQEVLRARVVAAAFGREERLTAPPAPTAPPEFIALKAHYSGDSLGGTVELHAFPGGYCGVAEIEGGRINVCALATRQSFRQAGVSVEGLLDQASRRNPTLAHRLLGLERTDPSFLTAAGMRFRRRQPIAGSMLCLGDSAAMAAPLCGDGIGIALASAALAHRWIVRHLEGLDSRQEMLDGYARDWRRMFLRPLAVGDVLQRFLMAPRAAGWTVRVCRTLPALTGWLLHQARAMPALR